MPCTAASLIELVDERQQFGLLRGVGAKPVEPALHADFLAVAALVAHVDLAGGIVAHEHGRERGRRAAAWRLNVGNLSGKLGAHLFGQGVAVEKLGGHRRAVRVAGFRAETRARERQRRELLRPRRRTATF